MYACDRCSRTFSIEEGVVRYSMDDRFYENRYEPVPLRFLPNEWSILGNLMLYFVSMHYFWLIKRYIPKGSHILDLAGGAGTSYLTTIGTVAGIDVSFPAAREMAKAYDIALQAEASKIPLANGSVDAIVCRFFLEHVRLEQKEETLGEIRRSLRNGGIFIALQDCDCDNVLWRWAKRDEALFKERFIENDGHHGLLRAEENLRLLKNSGFKILHSYAANKTPFVSLSMLEWMRPYGQKSKLAKMLLAPVPLISGNRLLNTAYTFSMTLFDDLVEPFLPMNHARYLLTVCQAG